MRFTGRTPQIARSQGRGLAMHRHARRVRAGFTLVEMMVALAILSLMMTIIFVPLNLGLNFFHIGNARSQLQQSAQAMLNRMSAELRQASFVFPNDALPGVTDKAPYTNNGGLPYYQSTTFDETVDASAASSTPKSIVCGSNKQPAGNPSRIDFLLPKMATNGSPQLPLTPGTYLVTYYARRQTPFDSSFKSNPFDGVDNPIVMYRAQMPLFDNSSPPKKMVDISDSRYPSGACSGNEDQTSFWLTESEYGEPNLEPLSINDGSPNPTFASHDLLTPRGMGLLASHATDPTLGATAFVPNTIFLCQDTDGDGKIDHVRITLDLAQYDEAGAMQTAQNVRLSEDVDLPNIQ
ncbi:MAG: prepilin-type N-terminal cleavage/methylation domain-containing protein [Abitibacteriaceae bacterium]|nr:prepilin-type N-terminal cleavage/methylation domain-containing protein [Abditibacteriaceae bacterium]MBV9867897.1 prepilin-type N-terminal cleavage/methylation domain-containing protein [Abditibacteriaceae bacterium]